MGKLNVNVGDEVYLKVKVTAIKEKPVLDGKEEDFYIDLAYPNWFEAEEHLGHPEFVAHVTWSQHLLFTPEGEEA